MAITLGLGARNNAGTTVTLVHVIKHEQHGDAVVIGVWIVGVISVVLNPGPRSRELVIELAVMKLNVGADQIGHHCRNRAFE